YLWAGFIHTQHISHLDIKVKNINCTTCSYINFKQPDNIMIRFYMLSLILSVHIADFGTALILDADTTESTRYAGTPEYMAPEVKNIETTKKPYNPYAADGTIFNVVYCCC